MEILKALLRDYGILFLSGSTLITAIVALFLEELRNCIFGPRLIIGFNEKREYPFFRNLAIGKYHKQGLLFRGVEIFFYRPISNVLVLVKNKGRNTAKNVTVRIEKIKIFNSDNEKIGERFYHPTNIHWSGEKEYSSVDILPKSHFFLDIFHSVNETAKEIVDLNMERYSNIFYEKNKKNVEYHVINKIKPSQEIYWNVWVDLSYERGIHDKYFNEGTIVAYFILNAENHKPIRFEAIVEWNRTKWNKPEVYIRKNNRFINSEDGDDYGFAKFHFID